MTNNPHKSGTAQPARLDASQQLVVWVLIALAAFALGLVVGESTTQALPGSRIEWPQPAHPKRILP